MYRICHDIWPQTNWSATRGLSGNGKGLNDCDHSLGYGVEIVVIRRTHRVMNTVLSSEMVEHVRLQMPLVVRVYMCDRERRVWTAFHSGIEIRHHTPIG